MVELIKQDFVKNKKMYNKVKRSLDATLETGVAIDHVGSTAIPDMYGKNIIDVLIGADSQAEFRLLLELISSQGYFASQNSKTDIYQFFASKQGETGDGDVHIHLAIKGTDRYEDFLRLRDYLLANPTEAAAYSNHKKELIEAGVTDRKEYRRVKSEYVSAMIERARVYADKNNSK